MKHKTKVQYHHQLIHCSFTEKHRIAGASLYYNIVQRISNNHKQRNKMAAAVAQSAFASPSQRAALKWAAGGWTFFIVENVVLSENRSWLIDQLGDEGYHGCYGTLSTLAMTSVGYAFWKKLPLFTTTSSFPTTLSRTRVGASVALTSTGLIMASQAFPKLQIPLAYEYNSNNNNSGGLPSPSPLPPSSPPLSSQGSWKVKCPFDFTDANDTTSTTTVRGLERISRHPGLWSFALLSAGQAMLAPTLAYQVWWTMPTFVAWIGGSHTDSRYRRGMGGTMDPHYDEQTSNIPLLALLTKRQGNNDVGTSISTFLKEELKPWNAVLATMVATAFVMKRAHRINARLLQTKNTHTKTHHHNLAKQPPQPPQ